MPSHPETLALIRAGMNEQGNLPIFNTSVNRVAVVSGNPDSNAMHLAMEVMKDANLSVNLLRLVNSPYYNRGNTKIGLLSQAILLLGFDTVKNACVTMKLLDSLNDGKGHSDMKSLLAHSYLSAGFVREVAAAGGLPGVEESYMCGLLHNLGEIMVAHYLPPQYQEVRSLTQAGEPWTKAQQKVLGVTFIQIAQDIATEWEFPAGITQTMTSYRGIEKGPINNKVQLNRALASLSAEIMGALYLPHHQNKTAFSDLLRQVGEAAGVDTHAIKNCLNTSFRMSCDLAQEYGLNKKLLSPRVIDSGDAARDRIVQQFSYYAMSRPDPTPADELPMPDAAPREAAAPVSDGATAPPRPSCDPMILLETIGEITTLINQRAALNTLFSKLLEGLHRGAGFERVVLGLLNPQHTNYAGRLAQGQNTGILKDYLSFPLDPRRDLFSHIILEGQELLVADVAKAPWAERLRPDFATRTGATSFATATFRSDSKPLGFFYADNGNSGSPVTAEQYRAFLQIISQGRLALKLQ